jgi:hypothetical protein
MRAAFVTLVVLSGCAKKPAPRACMDVTTVTTSATTRAVFEQRQCQGGGVTWAGILRVLARREGSLEPEFTLDDEADAARFCGPSSLVEKLRGEIVRLNADPKALEAAMAETTALELECFDDEGEVPSAPGVVPSPEPDPRLVAALEKQRTWCWPARSITHEEGKLRFEVDGGVTQTALDGGQASGRWRNEPEGRIEVVVPDTRSLHHFDVEDSGVLSVHFIDGLRADGTARIVIEELVPCR